MEEVPQASRKAIATLVVGEKYQDYWRRYCRRTWEGYCAKYGFDLVCFDAPLDDSRRAKSRSPAWQKCLVPGHRRLINYDQVVWVDSDVVMNERAAPDVVAGVPPDMVGAVEAFSSPPPPLFAIAHERMNIVRELLNIPTYHSPSGYYLQRGLTEELGEVVQTGVMVMSPTYHAELFERAYYLYEDRGPAYMHYEMPALSFEILKEGRFRRIDFRFNVLWAYEKALHYPFLSGRAVVRASFLARASRRILRSARRRRAVKLARVCALAALENSFFLHFAGCLDEIALVGVK